jgi:hypothetical protein
MEIVDEEPTDSKAPAEKSEAAKDPDQSEDVADASSEEHDSSSRTLTAPRDEMSPPAANSPETRKRKRGEEEEDSASSQHVEVSPGVAQFEMLNVAMGVES